MATELQRLLRGLCSGTGWTYAVFWRLQPHSPTMLTCDDAYYENCGIAELSRVNCSTKVVDDPNIVSNSQDPLKLALAQLSYQAYSLGEGIVGEVALTGEHKWISSDNYLPTSKDLDAWKAQFLAGVKTVLIAAVPDGVVQLGCLNRVDEEKKFLIHIRDAFHFPHDASILHSGYMPCGMNNLLYKQNLSMQALVSEGSLGIKSDMDKSFYADQYYCPSKHTYSEKQFSSSSGLPECGFSLDAAGEIFDNCDKLNNSKYHQFCQSLEAGTLENLENHKQVNEKDCSGNAADVETSILGPTCSVPGSNVERHLKKPIPASYRLAHDLPCILSDFSNSSAGDGYGAYGIDTDHSLSYKVVSGPSPELQEDLLMKFGCKDLLNYQNVSSTSLRFSTISELHEALGPAFQNKGNLCDSEEQKADAQKLHDVVKSSQFLNEIGSDHLLEAVVAKACETCSDDRMDKPFSKSEDSSNIRTVSDPASFSKLTISQAYSIDQKSQMEEDCLQSSERSLGLSSSVISSAYPSSGIDLAGRSSETTKNSRKRSRPGENRRPRPRDRQLIQDRLKELRELVPNGSKCSIDSLLERTIKHLLFLQGVTKHADKLKQFPELKRFRPSEMGMKRSMDSEQGSSWAVEVGSHLKVNSIVVENLSKNGELLVEMLCEDCSHFLEIAEAMRSLGLTILKGASEAHSDKIVICFIVEGQNNPCLHRMDVLWSLVQILQLNSSTDA